MSAEVAIIKNDCVVLAADSAVTIGNKHYNTDCKLFQLAENLPVGVMFFGRGTLCGVDLATLLKMFRQQIPQTPKQNLKEYPEAFVDFLQSKVETLFPHALQVRQLRHDADSWTNQYLRILNRAIDHLEDKKYNERKEFLTEEELHAASRRFIQSEIKELQENLSCWSVTDIHKWLATQTSDQIRKSIQDFCTYETMYRSGEDLIGEQESLLADLFVENYLRSSDREGSSGIVFAGYGTANVYPSVVCLVLDGIADNQVKFRYDDDKSLNVSEKLLSDDNERLNIAEVIPFAQATEMVELYTRGISFSLYDEIGSRLEAVLARHKVSAGKSKAIVEEINEAILEYSRENYSGALLGNIGLLPPEETAQLAELLIKLTSFRQHVSDEAEEVAEPIDVAVISKADGFIWHKRKTSIIQH